MPERRRERRGRSAEAGAGKAKGRGKRGERFRIRRAGPRDFADMMAVEEAAFDEARRQKPRNLRHGLASPSQSAFLLERVAPAPRAPAGLLILLHYPRSVRVYDVAVHPAHQGHGLGRKLLEHAERVARRHGASRMILEADPRAPGLVAMYEHLGYAIVKRLPHYYGRGRNAVRMVKPLP